MASEYDRPGEDALRERLYELMNDEDRSVAAKRREALEVGAAFLGVDRGQINRATDDGRLEVVAAVGTTADTPQVGETVDRGDAHCWRPIETASTVAFTDVGVEDPAAGRDAGCYLGVPVTVHGETYGTVCFFDDEPRAEPFETVDKLFVELVARLLGREIEANDYEETIDRAGRARERSERKYRTLLETAPNGIVLADVDTGEITGVNDRMTELVGRSRDELEGMRVFGLHPAEERQRYVELFARAGGREHRSRFDDGDQLHVERADGTTIPVEISVNTVELGDRTVIQGVFRDITDQRRRERELERNQRFLERTQEAVDLGGWEFDATTGALRCTDEIHRIYGLPVDEELTLETALALFHPDDADRVGEAYGRLVTEAEPFDLEVRLIAADGQRRWVRVIGGPIYEDDGETVAGFRGVTRDITERRRREADLRMKNRAVEEASVGIFIAERADAGGRLTYVNEEFEQLTGYEAAAVEGRPSSVLENGAVDGEISGEIADAFDGRGARERRLLLRRTDGTSFWGELTVTPVGGADTDEITHCVGFLRDITPVKRRERLIDVLDRVLRHNIRNDMNVIGGYAATIADRADGTLARMGEQIETTASELAALSEKARTLEETMATPTTPAVRDVTADVRSAVERLRDEYPETEFTVEVPDDCRAVGTDRLERALYELGDNAAKHADGLPVAVTADRAGDRIDVEISDAGPGLSEREQEVIESGRETPLEHGQGLGLWLVNWIVTGAGGDLAVDVDDGTTVTVTLHAGTDASEAVPAEYYRQAALGTRAD